MPMSLSRSFRVEWFVLVAASVALAALFAYHLFYRYDQLITQKQTQLLHSAAASDVVISKQLESYDITLKNIRSVFSPGWQARADTGKSYQMRLNALVTAMPNVQTISIFDSKGVVTASSKEILVGESFAYRDYFRVPKADPSVDRLYLSYPFQGIYNDWLIGLSKVITDKQGRFAGIALILLNSKEYRQTLDTLRPSPQAWAALADSSGLLFAWEPETLGLIGQNIATGDGLFIRHLRSGNTASIYSGVVAANNENSLVAIRTIKPTNLNMNKPLVLAVGRNLRELQQTLHRDLFFISIVFLIITFTSGIALSLSQRARRAARRATINAERRTQAISQQLSSFFDLTPSLMLITDMNASYRRLNPAVESTLGYSQEDLYKSSLFDFVHPDDIERIRSIIQSLQEGHSSQNILVRFRNKSGDYRYLESSLALLDDMLFIAALDVTDRETEKLRLQSMAYHDRLTGLPNRALFIDRLNQIIAQCSRENRKAALLFLDLDGFKPINDVHGHEAGDTVLVTLAQRFNSAIRKSDTVARLGGDEFVVALYNVDTEDDAARVAQIILDSANKDITLESGKSVQIGVSIGIAIWPDHGETVEALINAADQAMYKSKNRGRNTYTIASAKAANQNQ